jgi:hypothetical protein
MSDSSVADSVIINWSNNEQQILLDLPANNELLIVQGQKFVQKPVARKNDL